LLLSSRLTVLGNLMNSILVFTPCSLEGPPTHGALIAECLRGSGIRTRVITEAKTGLGRLIDVAFRGFFSVPSHDLVLVNVFGHRAFVYESLAILYARFWKKPLIVLLHGGWLSELVDRWPTWVGFILSLPNIVLVPHSFLLEQLTEKGLRIDGTIPNFIELEKYTFRHRSVLSPRFLYLRGLHPVYNPEMAIRAFALIQSKHPNALLTIAGPEYMSSAPIRALIGELGVRNVEFVGLMPKDQIPLLADQHDIHLHTNRVDNMPVSIIEMWACGVPVVGTNVGGMPYLIRNRVDGVLVDSEDHRAMADACFELLSNPELASKLSRNGRARAEELSWERVRPAWDQALIRAANAA
jgi:glycosyltransferase involved in cell wall biosynthesis